ncbi:type II toxin-antitoxin system death-on-curing family toxin [Salibacterium qingdaonense]|uniref:Death on curing protein n=1 Tax=Salibacterium qingdaonense TaxID=266892 RepID=A0A1I4LP25_9BACI|nr:type II toxin-antitoxin system death-on-curing family toxin [Salibacterium qingdaonense]SFL92772.1 death on curing protein [Salibacterium qingdaonense]
MAILYLRTKDVALIHFMMMKKFKDEEQAGIKDQGLLESAVHRPKQSDFGEGAYPGLFEKASALFESLARNHCFHNGNKRTAFAAVDVFLKKNGCKINKNDTENENFTVSAAQGEVTFADIADWLKDNTEEYPR